MVSFGSPLWLTGLLALLLVWWLHRRSPVVPAIPVSALFLWRGATPPASSGLVTHKAHPLWLLRALILSALLFSLSEMSVSPFDTRGALAPEPENAAVSEVSLRRSLQDPEQVIGIAGITYTGQDEASRSLTITAATATGVEEVASRGIALAPGSRSDVTFMLRKNAMDLTAALAPEDSVTNDDRMVLSLQAIRPVTTSILGNCNATLLQALAAHPGISVAPHPVRGELTIVCAADRDKAFADLSPTPPAVLWFGSGAGADRPQLRWLEWTGTLAPESRYLRYPVPALPVPPWSEDARIVLQAIDGHTPLIIERDGYLEVYLDLIPAPDVAPSETLALFAAILDAMMGRALLDPIVSGNVETSGVDEEVEIRSRSDLAGLLIGAAMMLVMLELFFFAGSGAGVTRATP